MPLTAVARGYADKLLQKKMEEILRLQSERLVDTTRDFARRNVLQSGGYISTQANTLVDGIRHLAQAKADSLVTAYEKSGVPFDDLALQEITDEVMQFTHSRQHDAIGKIGDFIHQTFPSNSAPHSMIGPVNQQIQRDVSGIMAAMKRDLSIKRDEVVLDELRTRKVYGAGLGKKWDVFICHASEDKAEFVGPLARSLVDTGLAVWFDEFSLRVGDSLRKAIDEGLANSRFGVVVLSKHFFEKDWPQRELDGLVSKEIAGTKVILPVWYDISFEDVGAKSPMLAGLLAAKSSEGLPVVVRQLREAMGL